MLLFSTMLFAIALIALQVSALRVQNRQRTDTIQGCIEDSVASFNLLARYKDTPDVTVPVKIVYVDSVPEIGYSILSACPDCDTIEEYNVLQNNGIIPHSSAHLNTVSYTLNAGDSPAFISEQYAPHPLQAYCFTENPVNHSGPPVLAGNGNTEAWSLCPNTSTTDDRLDVVWSAIADHPHYHLEECAGIYLEQV